jgi:hypothetical protein
MAYFLILCVLFALSFAGAESFAKGRTARTGGSEGSVPNLDIASGCRSLTRYDPGRTVNYDACIKEERDARVQIQNAWRSAPAGMREQCLHLVTPPALPSYISLQGCLTMAHDAAELAKKGETNRSTEPAPSVGGERRPRRAGIAPKLPY